MLNILFFGQLRERLNTSHLSIEIDTLPQSPNVDFLCDYLAQRGPDWQMLINSQDCLVAVNQTMATWQTAIFDNDEIALFPPVTGG